MSGHSDHYTADIRFLQRLLFFYKSWAGLTCMASEVQVLHVVEAGNTLVTLLVAALAVV